MILAGVLSFEVTFATYKFNRLTVQRSFSKSIINFVRTVSSRIRKQTRRLLHKLFSDMCLLHVKYFSSSFSCNEFQVNIGLTTESVILKC